MEPITEIPDRADFYANWLVPRRPMWLRLGDLARLGWRTADWTPDYLIRRAGTQRVKVLQRRNPEGSFQPENTDYVDMMFGEFVRRVMQPAEGTDELYLNLQEGYVMEPPLLQLLGDFSIPDFYCEVPMQSVNLWLGKSRRGIITALHHDFHDNMYCIARGRKHVTLYPPEQASNLYPRGDLRAVEDNGFIDYRDMKTKHMPHMAQVDPDDPDLERFPGYRTAAGYREECELEAGDLLFIPAGWFHQVRSLPGEHIALSFFALPPEVRALRAMREKIRDPAFMQRMKAQYRQMSQ